MTVRIVKPNKTFQMRLKINMSTLIILSMIAYKFYRHEILHEHRRLCEQYEAIYI